MVELDPKVIVREEAACYLLYNGLNLGLISVSKEAYHRCILKDNFEKQDETFLNWLFTNSFLKEKPQNPTAAPVDDGVPHTAATFYDIKSEISPLNILWALSPKCNLSCIYCFPDAKTHQTKEKTLTLREFEEIADKIIQAKAFKVTLTGGECLLLEDLWSVVEKLKAAGVTVAVLTNGVSMPPEVLQKIKAFNLFVGISLDGSTEEVNSLTRGKSAFQKTVNTIKKLIENGVSTTVMVTVTKHNFSEIEKIADLASALGVSAITLQDLRPFGTKNDYDQLKLTPVQEKKLKNLLTRLIAEYPKIFFNTAELTIFDRANPEGNQMQCPAGDNFAYIDFYGDLYPCTSLSTFKLGNLLGGSISELWQNSESIKQLRAIKASPIDNLPECRSCANKVNCDGGCRGDALFYNNDLLGLPSRCPKALGNL
ncbi:MAG: radical SAM protein [Candidatus Bathyarchaeota archaeon]|nr:radical SAM protein [Candidatus Bathyarchaeota archaeon]